MCGITGAISAEHSEQITLLLSRLAHRGRDGQQIVRKTLASFAHALHAIVGHELQPFEAEDFVFGVNGEIYNWQELGAKKEERCKNDAHLFFSLLTDLLKNKRLTKESAATIEQEVLSLLDGVYAFFLYDVKTNNLVLGRDVLGVKPLWFVSDEEKFLFASEKKAFADVSPAIPEELNPRNLLFFDGMHTSFIARSFFSLSENNEFSLEDHEPDILLEKFSCDSSALEAFRNDLRGDISKEDFEKLISHISSLLVRSVAKRIPDVPAAVLYSGGIDSTLLAFILSKLGKDIVGVMAFAGEETEEVKRARMTAQTLGFPFLAAPITTQALLARLQLVPDHIESADPVKCAIAITFDAAVEALHGKRKVIFSGLGADDIFIGYKRMLEGAAITEDSLSYLRRLYERDLYRDDVIAMLHQTELRVPFLDKALVSFLLSLPSTLKVGAKDVKPLLRAVASFLGMPSHMVTTQRRAAQYSSRVTHELQRLLKDDVLLETLSLPKKPAHVRELFSLLTAHRIPLASLLSTGKDSVLALHVQQNLNYAITTVVTIASKNQDSFMFHTPTIELAKLQAESMGLPLVMQETRGEKEDELADLRTALLRAKETFHIRGVVSGALFSNYQRTRIERVCDELNLKCYSPLWHMEQRAVMKMLFAGKFSFMFTKVAALGLDASWLARPITESDLVALEALHAKYGVNIAGEGGEFESLVLDAPLFSKRINIETKIVQDDELSAHVEIVGAGLTEKK
ncbi:MAG: diphthine--ammonia ligase [Candidatus Woesearchaeota archaeon]|nr:MAG: diphthine--ammonia ligase [Candidatus Woesearchaeota archaeon]